MSTTLINPGAYKPFPDYTVHTFSYQFIRAVKRKSITGVANFLLTAIPNYNNQKKSRPKFFCNCCGSALPRLVHRSNKRQISWNSACPNCDARKRHRGLMELYKELIFKPESKILHFAPEPILSTMFQRMGTYETTDLYLKDVTWPNEDIQKLSLPSCKYDFVLINHVLEHIFDDKSAITEINRVLNHGGIAIITVPGNWKKNKTIRFRDLSNNGHYRHYGLDFVDKLKNIFSKVILKDLYDYNFKFGLPLGLLPGRDIAFICQKE